MNKYECAQVNKISNTDVHLNTFSVYFVGLCLKFKSQNTYVYIKLFRLVEVRHGGVMCVCMCGIEMNEGAGGGGGLRRWFRQYK